MWKVEGKVKKRIKYSLAGIMTSAIIGSAACFSASAATVDVYAEGAYTDTDLVVYIYADISQPIVSAGVALSYDNTKLSVLSADKNEATWYFGQAGVQTYDYQDPTDRGSDVLFLCGKIEETDPLQGVSGTRVLIGTATFQRLESGAPGTTPEAYFGAGLDVGIVRTPPAEFANFVTTSEVVLDSELDGLSFSTIIRERGDANLDGVFTNLDIFAVKDAKSQPYSVIADCNGLAKTHARHPQSQRQCERDQWGG